MNETPLAPMSWRDRIGIVAILTIIVAVLFHESFKPAMVHFSSDGPLGIMAAKDLALPDGFSGLWFDSNWLGGSLGGSAPCFTFFMMWVLGPLGSAKFLMATFVLVLGLCAAFCFRIFGFRPMVCLLGGIAAELNSNFLSNSCWGVGSRCSSLAATFLALAALWSSRRSYPWLKIVLAGFATGMAVMEGADNGMFFSLFVAAFAFYLALIDEGPVVKRIFRGVATVAVVAAFAGFIAYQSIQGFVGANISGIVGMKQEAEDKKARWNQATQWSLPKAETFRVLIPGLFGYRMDTPDGGNYWGRVGEAAEAPQSMPRYSGAGEYAGVLVVLVAAWAVARSLSRKAQTYSAVEKKIIWFWAVAGFIAVLLAWGRYAPFYQLFYALPHMSTIRNPMKFMHPAHMTLMILFAYGLQGMSREYLEKVKSATTAGTWEKRWKYASIAAVVVCALGWFVYSAQKSDLVSYMTAHYVAATEAPAIASFSIKETGLFVLVLAISTAALLALQAGMFRGPRAIWGGLVLGLILTADLARADAPWIQYFDYKTRYASHPVLDVLKDHSWEHRVTNPDLRMWLQDPTLRNFFEQRRDLFQYVAQFAQFYHSEWVQHQFQYYNIQMMDVAQEPRMATEKQMYLQYVGNNLTRYWQLTNTRFIFGAGGGFADVLNQRLDPVQKRFRVHTAFNLFQKGNTPYIGAETNANGALALIEFTGALPRASLYSQWQVMTNNEETLKTLADPNFKPEEVVLVNEEIPPPPPAATGPAGTVTYESYAPKRIVQKVSANTPSLLLMNDRHHPDWQVSIDGKPAKLLRCNFVVRGLQVPAGQHTINWEFKPDLKVFWISSSAVAMAFVLCAVTWFLTMRPRAKSK
jgi:hypothetical protein